MTEWLMKKDSYLPPADKDSFIDKSLLSVLSVLSRIRRGGNLASGFFYRLNPALKSAFTFLSVLLLSLSQSFNFIMLICAYFLLTLGFLELKDIKKTALITLTVGFFSVLILLPSVLAGNRNNSMMLFLKITGSVAAVNILANSTKWSHITRSMKVFHIPDIFILVLDITIKYIVILGEYSVNMLYALKLRSIGRNNRKYQSLSNLMGGLFLKSKEMAELTYSAMECRGFDGHYTIYGKNHFNTMDYIYIPANILLISAFFFFK